ncbi:MAG: bacillithiol biosynthesis cysteine-adding enzyme BshC [Thalassobius sp.]|nr:bacillithiol biosynthesis cysteine-adding enzyme BshC [Thalassovita sp.]
MKNTKISFEDTRQFSDLFLDYINQKETVKSFYELPPQLESFEKQIKNKQAAFSTSTREKLYEVLVKQYEGLEHMPKASIELLKADNTFTVITGHQLNIFSGPLYFIYKIVSVINLARKLADAYPKYNFVPVYWMATEDHDFEEIKKIVLFGKEYIWEHPEANGAVGKLDLKGVETFIESVGEVPEFLKDAYLNSDNLAEATRKFVNHLFGKEGLVIVDADCKELKEEFKEVIKDDLLNHNAKQKADEATAALEELGYKSQIFPRDINFFYLQDGLRERIEREGDTYQVLNSDISFSQEQILEELEKNPECFSPNVVLRPLYQEVILPNLAYIGGPSEVVYWLQLKGVFDHFNTPFPILLPRNFALVINKSNGKKFQKLGLSHNDLFKDEHQLKSAFVNDNSEVNLGLDQEITALEKIFEGILSKAVSIDASLKGYVGAETQRMVKQMENIKKRLKKAEENKQETEIKQLLNLKDKLFPNGVPQERLENFLSFYLNNPDFIKDLIYFFNPLEFSFNILEDE